MKIFKRIFAVLLSLALLFSLASCADKTDGGTDDTESTASYIRENKTKIAVPNSVFCLGIAKLGADRDYAYTVTRFDTLQEIEEQLKNGGTDIAALPVENAARLFNETKGGIKIIAVNNLGVLHLVTSDSGIASLADIKDKTVYATGKGTAYEHIINYIFEKNAIAPRIEYVETESELATLAIEGKADICIIPEPQAAKVVFENTEMKRVIDFNDEWNKVSDVSLVQGVIVARTEYIEQNPEYMEQFLFHNEVSLNFLNENSGLGADLLYQNSYYSSVELAEESIPAGNLYFIKGEEMKAMIQEVCDVLSAADPELTGGTVSADGICYVQ